jgi:hypothetical protein
VPKPPLTFRHKQTTTCQPVSLLYSPCSIPISQCSIGRSDDVSLVCLKKAVSCCELFEAQTGSTVQGREIFEEALQEILVAMGAEQSEYGGIAVSSNEPTENSKNEGLLKARK